MGRFELSSNVLLCVWRLVTFKKHVFPCSLSVFCNFSARLFQNTKKYLYLGSRIVFATIQTLQNTQSRLEVNSKLLEMRYLEALHQFSQVIDAYFKENNYRSSCCPKSN
jgi:hypothetical protein